MHQAVRKVIVVESLDYLMTLHTKELTGTETLSVSPAESMFVGKVISGFYKKFSAKKYSIFTS